MNFEAGEVLGILILANVGVMLYRPHFLLKWILALQLHSSLFRFWYWRV